MRLKWLAVPWRRQVVPRCAVKAVLDHVLGRPVVARYASLRRLWRRRRGWRCAREHHAAPDLATARAVAAEGRRLGAAVPRDSRVTRVEP